MPYSASGAGQETKSPGTFRRTRARANDCGESSSLIDLLVQASASQVLARREFPWVLRTARKSVVCSVHSQVAPNAVPRAGVDADRNEKPGALEPPGFGGGAMRLRALRLQIGVFCKSIRLHGDAHPPEAVSASQLAPTGSQKGCCENTTSADAKADFTWCDASAHEGETSLVACCRVLGNKTSRGKPMAGDGPAGSSVRWTAALDPKQTFRLADSPCCISICFPVTPSIDATRRKTAP